MYNEGENVTESRKTKHGVEWYREGIVKMIGQIDNEIFLRRIYIIISDNMNVKPE